MKLSFTTMATPGLELKKSLKMAKNFGYQGVDIRVSDHFGEIALGASYDEIARIRSAFDRGGITLSSLLCYNETGGKDDCSWNTMRDSLLSHLELAGHLAAPSIRIFGSSLSESECLEYVLKRTVEVITRVLETDETDVQILLQHHEGSFNASQAMELARLVNSPRFGLVFSPDHCIIQHENMVTVCEDIRKYARQIYIADLKKDAVGHHCVLPGKGQVPFAQCWAALGADFDGWVTFKWEKIWLSELEEPEIALPHFTTNIKSILGSSIISPLT